MLIQYADLQITRVALWSDGPVDLLAYVTRNLLEWSLWCKIVSETPETIGKLMNDSQADLVDVLKFSRDPDFYSAALGTHEIMGPVSAAVLERFQDATAKVFEAFETEPDGLPTRQKLSRDKLENFVFKICSKLLHPSSLSILVLPNEAESQLESRRVHLRSVALFYAKVGLDALSAIVDDPLSEGL
jgi:hypothetical protein